MPDFNLGLLSDQQELAVRNCIERLHGLLATATKKRPLDPPNLLIGKANGQKDSVADGKAKLKQVHLLNSLLYKFRIFEIILRPFFIKFIVWRLWPAN